MNPADRLSRNSLVRMLAMRAERCIQTVGHKAVDHYRPLVLDDPGVAVARLYYDEFVLLRPFLRRAVGGANGGERWVLNKRGRDLADRLHALDVLGKA